MAASSVASEASEVSEQDIFDSLSIDDAIQALNSYPSPFEIGALFVRPIPLALGMVARYPEDVELLLEAFSKASEEVVYQTKAAMTDVDREVGRTGTVPIRLQQDCHLSLEDLSQCATALYGRYPAQYDQVVKMMKHVTRYIRG